MSLKSFKYFFAIIIAFLISCDSEPIKNDEQSQTVDSSTSKIPDQSASVRPVEWSYHKEGGPAGWAGLSPVYALCGAGKTQSPINILKSNIIDSIKWSIEYKSTRLQISHNLNVEELINNGHTIEITPQEGSLLNYGGKVFDLKQFHFHTPSEHTMDGKNDPMEIHFVHQSEDGILAVIGVLVKEGRHNANFDQLIKYLPNAAGEKKTYDSVRIEIPLHVPKDLSAYHYIGSLTTPPCTENVRWLVLQKPIELDKDQITAFATRLNNNNRPTQKLNDRTISINKISSKKN